MKFLIAGLGSIGRRHLRNLKALGESDILLFRTHRATLSDDELAGIPFETDLQHALASKPDAVIVANPTSIHLDVAIPAAKLGCHLLLEKPVSDSLAGLDDLATVARKSGSHILVGFQFHFHPTLQKTVELLQAGAIGRLLSIRAQWGEYLPGWHPWEDYKQGYAARADLGGGAARSLTHPLDYLRWLCGDVQSLWAFTGNLGLGLPVEDTAEIGLRFVNGAIGSVQLNYNQRPAAHHLELIGTEGTLRWDNTDGSLHVFRASSIAQGQDHGGGWEHFLPPAGFDRNTMFLDEMRHFLSVMRGEAEPVCTMEDGKWALRLALAALESDQTGRKIILEKGI
ncbi:MAG TPA: Gfo/Idh/MocA family oxidoreductase [Anaerolineales bacterium]